MKRMRIAVLAGIVAVVVAGLPDLTVAGSCAPPAGLAERPHGGPIAEPRYFQPVNGTGGFSVFGANTVGRGGFSLGVGYMGENAVCQDKGGDFDLNTLWIPLHYGVTERFQIGVDLPYTWYEANKAHFSGQGVDDVNFGGVYRLFDEAGPAPAVALVGFLSAPTGSVHQGISRHHWDAGVKVAFSKTLPWNLLGHANLGYIYAGDKTERDDQFTSGVALEYPINRHFSLVAEGLADTNQRTGGDRHSDWVSEGRAGFRVRYGNFLVSMAGRKGFTNDAPDWGMFVLITYTQQGEGGAAAGGPGAGAPGAAGPAAGAGGPAAGGPAGPAGPAPGGPGAAGPGAGGPGPAGPGAAGPGAAGPGAAGPGAGGPAGPAGPAPGGPGAAGPGAVAAVPPAALPAPLRSALRDLNFEFDRYELTDEAKRILDELAPALTANPRFSLLIEGHADERGTDEYNVALGERRAQVAKDYLVAKGIAASRLDTISYGEERPLDPGHDELAWALNRRAHFTVRANP